MALALAFGLARVAVSIFSVLTVGVMPWITSGGVIGNRPFVGLQIMLEPRFLLFQLVTGFLGGAIAGWVSAAVYNKVVARRAQAV
jgi:hypothetical protein